MVSLHCSLWLVLKKNSRGHCSQSGQSINKLKKTIVCLVFTSSSNWFLVLFSSVPFGLCDYFGFGWTLQATDSRRHVRVLWRTVRVSLLKLTYIFNRASAVKLLFPHLITKISDHISFAFSCDSSCLISPSEKRVIMSEGIHRPMNTHHR